MGKRIKLDRKIKFTNKKHSFLGFVSMLIGLGAVSLFLTSFLKAFNAKGSAVEDVGVFGGLSLITGILGFILGMYSLKNKEVFYTFSWIGIFINLLVWLVMIFILLIGV